MKKEFFALAFLLFYSPFIFPSFAENPEELFSGGNEDFDIDDFFSDSDVEEPVVVEKNDASTVIAGFSVPLTFSGSLTADVGFGYEYDKAADEGNKNGYVDFANYLYLKSFPTQDLGIRGTIYSCFPNYKIAEFYELYLDYICLDRFYVTIGKKTTTWGYVRLFTESDSETTSELNQKNFGFETNILSDSRSGTSLLLRVPVWTGTVSLIALAPTTTKPKINDICFAGSVEMNFGKTCANLFARKYPSQDSDYVGNSCSTKKDSDGNDVLDADGNKIYLNGLLFGLEAKRTFFGADVYAQGMAKFADNSQVKALLKLNASRDTFGDVVCTVGAYRWWDNFDVNFGFNVEFQSEYLPLENYHDRRIGFDGGVKRIGPKKNIKIGAEWMHSITRDSGYLKPGVVISGILPHTDWNNGLKFEYENFTLSKIIFGTYFEISLNY